MDIGVASGHVLETAHTVPPTANSDDLKRRKFEIHLQKKKRIFRYIQVQICRLASII